MPSEAAEEAEDDDDAEGEADDDEDDDSEPAGVGLDAAGPQALKASIPAAAKPVIFTTLLKRIIPPLIGLNICLAKCCMDVQHLAMGTTSRNVPARIP